MGVIAETAVRVRADTSGFQGEAHRGVMGSIAKVGAAAAGALGGLAIGKALFVDPIKQAGNFEQSLNVLQATSHATDARMKEISATAMKLGNDTKLPAVSATDAANAMLELAKGGFSAKESMEGARGVLLLSTAAQIDGASAATLVADSLHAFGLKAKDAGVVVNDFAGAANASTASMDEVGQSLQQSGQAFHQLGIPIGDATTAIAAMANAGIKGSDAGTSLKTMLQRLNPTTAAAKKEMREMGVHTFDAQGKFVGMRGVIEQMGPKLRAMSQEQRQAALNTIFGSDASRAAGIILGQTTEQWDKQHAAVTKAGQAQALADAQTKGFKGAMAGLRSTIETLQLQIGLKMLPVLTTFVRFLSSNLPAAASAVGSALGAIGDVIRDVTDWLGIFQDHANAHGLDGLSNGLDTTRTRFDEIVGAIRGAVNQIREWANWISDNVGNLRQIATALGVGAAAFVVLTAAVRAYTAVQAVLNAVMTANPIGLLIVAIAALVVGLTLLYQRSETARNIMNAVFATLRAAAETALGFITNTVIPNAIAAWNRFGPGVVSALQSAVAGIRTVVEAIATVVRTVVEQIRAHWDGIWKVFGPIVNAQLTIVRTTVKTVLDVIAGVVRLFAALLRGDWGAAWNALKGIVSDVLGAVKTVVSTALTALATTAKNLAEAVGSKLAAGIKTAAAKLAGLGGDLVGKIAAAAGEAAKAAFRMGVRIADSVISGLGNIGERVANKLSFGLVGGSSPKVPGPVKPTGSGGQGSGSGGGSDAINLQTDSIIAGINFGGKLRAKILTEMGNLFPPTVGATMVSQLATIFNATTTAVQAGVTRMTAGMRGVRERLSSSLDGLGAQMDTKLQPLIDKIAAAPEKSREKLTTAARAVEKPMVDAFVKWIDSAKATYDAKVAQLMTTVDATFAKAQAKLDKWKASATPTEMRVAALQAQAAQAQVDNAVIAARASLAKLDSDFQKSWSKLLADQAKNMAALKATQASTITDKDIAGHEFDKTQAATANDPTAVQALNAQKNLDTVKAAYAAGTATQAQLFAAQDAFDTASLAAADNTNAQKLLQDYATWQNLVAQAATGAAGISEQEAADAEQRAQAQESYGEARKGAEGAVTDAITAQNMFALQQQATNERAARDAMFETMSNQLKQRHDRIILHLQNVQHAHDLAFDKLKADAAQNGKIIGDNLADGMNRAIPTVRNAASALAAVVRQYLKLASPAEKGPMSDLDRWWGPMGKTLASGLDTREIQSTLSSAVAQPGYARMPAGSSTRGGFGDGSSGADRYRWERIEALLGTIAKHTGATAAQKPAKAPEIHVSGGVGIDASVYRSKR